MNENNKEEKEKLKDIANELKNLTKNSDTPVILAKQLTGDNTSVIEQETLIADLVDVMYKQPTGSIPYFNIRDQISNSLKKQKKYYTEILCFTNGSDFDNKLLKEFTNPIMDVCADVFDSYRGFLFDEMYTFAPRHEVEYNLRTKQIIVAGYIIDKYGEMILLNSKEGRLKDKITMVQGHVDYSPSCLLSSEADFLRENMKRELLEEINIGEDVRYEISEQPLFLINSKESFIDLEHFGVIYEIKVPDITMIKNKISSNEISKHDIYYFSLEHHAYRKLPENMDSWTKLVVQKLLKKRDF